MDVAALLPQAVGDRAQEGDDVVVDLLQVALEVVQVIAGLVDLLRRLLGDVAALGPGVTDGDLDLEPAVVLALVGPDGGHLRS